jgi:hypothetical protein
MGSSRALEFSCKMRWNSETRLRDKLAAEPGCFLNYVAELTANDKVSGLRAVSTGF